MKKTAAGCVLLLAAWLTGSAAFAQPPANEPVFPPPSPFAPLPEATTATVPALAGLSDWIRYPRECCEGAHGPLTPLYTELYFGSGASFPMAKGTSELGHEMQTGWILQGGARGLLFNEEMTAAWLLDLHVINIHQTTGAHSNNTFPLTVYENGVTITSGVTANGSGVGKEPNFHLEDYNRTMAGLGFGRAWYLLAPANAPGPLWRIGVDGGVRGGAERLDVYNAARSSHTTDQVYDNFIGIFTDLEIPWGAVLFNAGFRCEWAYTYSGILETPSNSQEINLTFNIGVRY